ncbi:MAG TPA: phospholipase D-like domain-containing protein, partial [Ktedonobacteraceae bacterium]|nr:phospholipase D-like domain-containing protein [Ktedonobacteraceae bacterium]
QDGSPEQESLLEELRAEGLGAEEIALWTTQELTLQNVLSFKVSQGVEVKALVWECLPIFTHLSPQTAYEQLTAIGVSCILDDSAKGLMHHPVEALHQKISVIDGTHAFVGGIDLLIDNDGDYDRWDMHRHHYSSDLRRNQQTRDPHPWHDAHAILEGTAVGDVELNFRQRWNNVVERHKMDRALLIPERPMPAPKDSRSVVQVVRTIPEHTYDFDPDPGIQGIAQVYVHALANAQRFVYLENQYFWLHAYFGLDIAAIGLDSPDMERNIRELGAALQRGATVSIILPDHPNVGRAFTDAGLERLRQEAPDAAAQGRLQVFCLATSMNLDGAELYRPIYVHAKVAVIDDTFSTVGSGNLNNRGMRDDTEMNVAVLDSRLAHGLRMMLVAEHLGLYDEDELLMISRHLGNQRQRAEREQRAIEMLAVLEEQFGNPRVALEMMVANARENMRRYQAHQPLVGHLLPYFTYAEAQRAELRCNEDSGWLE